MRTSARAAFAGAAVLTALLAIVPLTGCGGGGKGSAPTVTTTRAKGAVTMAVVWPERSRLIPDASDHIVVTLTRTPDANLATPFKTALTFDRPANPPWLVERTTEQLPTGTYTATAVATKFAGDGSVINPNTGDNVPQAAKTVPGVTVTDNATTKLTLTMDSTIATLTPAFPTGLEVAADGIARIRPGEKVKLNVRAFDATPDTATPPGPYLVPVTTSKLTFVSSDTSVATVDANGVVTGATLGASTVAKIATITVKDTESGKTGTIAVTVVPVGLSQTAQWAKFHADLANTGNPVNPNANISDNPSQVFPSIDTGSTFVLSSAVIAQDGTFYIGTRTKGAAAAPADQRLYAYNPDNTLKWSFASGGDIDSAAVIGRDGTIYFGTMNGDVYALQDNGQDKAPTIIWQRKVGPVQASLTIDRFGTIYVATVEPDNKLYAFNGLTGGDIKASTKSETSRIWTFSGNGGVLGTPALSADQKRIYIASRGTNNSTVYIIQTGIPDAITTGVTDGDGLDYKNGGALGFFSTATVDGGVSAAPVVATIGGRQTLFVATTAGSLLALDAINGGAITLPGGNGQPWVYDAGAPIYGTPALSSDTTAIYLATLDITSGIFDHKVVAVDTATAAQIWRSSSPAPDGTPRFTDGFTSSPALSGDGTRLFIGGLDGNLYAFDTADTGADHEPVWSRQLLDSNSQVDRIESSPAIGSDGQLILGGVGGSVYVYK